MSQETHTTVAGNPYDLSALHTPSPQQDGTHNNTASSGRREIFDSGAKIGSYGMLAGGQSESEYPRSDNGIRSAETPT